MNKIQINGFLIETDGPASVTITDGMVYVNGKHVIQLGKKNHQVTINGDVNELKVEGNADVNGNVKGNIDAGGNVMCKNVSGDIDAGGNVSAHNAKQNIDAGGNVTIKK